MNQVGDSITISLSPAPSGTAIYSYVWDFWDGDCTATAQPFVTKVLNIGGQPGTDSLGYTCTPVARDGQSVVLAGTVTCNNPPLILPGVAISANDGVFTYSTDLSLTAIDVDGDDIAFAWYTGTTYLGAGTSSFAGNFDGTWRGNGVTDIVSCAGTTAVLTRDVSSDHVVTCYARDTRGGTTAVDFTLRGERAASPSALLSAAVGGISFDASTPPAVRIGAGANVAFTVYSAPLPNHFITFQWNFYGSNGWSTLPATEIGVTTVTTNGGFQSTTTRDISAEVVSSGTSKAAIVDVLVTAYNVETAQARSTTAQFEITLIKNSPPNAVTIARSVGGNAVVDTGPVASGDVIEFSGTGADANKDTLFYLWKFSQPLTLSPTTRCLWGAKVLYDTTGYTSADVVQGQLTVFDRLGDSLIVELPLTNIS